MFSERKENKGENPPSSSIYSLFMDTGNSVFDFNN